MSISVRLRRIRKISYTFSENNSDEILIFLISVSRELKSTQFTLCYYR